MRVPIRLQAKSDYSRPKDKLQIFTWPKIERVALDNKPLRHIRRIGESKTWLCEVLRVTMDYIRSEHSLAMLGDDIHVLTIGRNLAGRGCRSVRGSGRVSARGGGHESNGQ